MFTVQNAPSINKINTLKVNFENQYKCTYNETPIFRRLAQEGVEIAFLFNLKKFKSLSFFKLF